MTDKTLPRFAPCAWKPAPYGGKVGVIERTLNHPFRVKESGWTATDELRKLGRKTVHFEDTDGEDIPFAAPTNIYAPDQPNVGSIPLRGNQADRIGALWGYTEHQLLNGNALALDLIATYEHPAPYLKPPVYNVEVEDCHTCHVGEHGIGGHNQNCGPLSGMPAERASPPERQAPGGRATKLVKSEMARPAVAVGALLLGLAAGWPALAQSTPAGVWKTYDDTDGLPASLVRIEEKNGVFEGRVVKILPRPGHDDTDARCTKCEGENKDQPITGMKILWDMRREGDEYGGGRIFDPDSGNTYRCTLRLEDGKLKVRGFIGISLFGRTQTWVRAQ